MPSQKNVLIKHKNRAHYKPFSCFPTIEAHLRRDTSICVDGLPCLPVTSTRTGAQHVNDSSSSSSPVLCTERLHPIPTQFRVHMGIVVRGGITSSDIRLYSERLQTCKSCRLTSMRCRVAVQESFAEIKRVETLSCRRK